MERAAPRFEPENPTLARVVVAYRDAVVLDKGVDFVGRAALAREKAEGTTRSFAPSDSTIRARSLREANRSASVPTSSAASRAARDVRATPRAPCGGGWGGPAGLMAAEVLAMAGVAVTVFERMPTVGRKLLLAGRGGLNITHTEPLDKFLDRYGNALTVRRARDRRVRSTRIALPGVPG